MNKIINYILMFLRGSGDEQSQGYRQEESSLKNFAIKILALLMAIGLWLYVMNEQNPPIEARYSVPLEIRNVPPNYVLVDHPDYVRIKIRGPRTLVAGTTSQDIKAFVNMNGMSEGRHNMNITAVIPPSLELIDNIPETAAIRLEPIITRAFPIMVEFGGVLSDRFNVSKVNTKLNQATVKGPRYLVDTIDKLIGTVDISGKKDSFSTEIPLTPLGRNGIVVEGVTISPDTISVHVDIEAAGIKKIVDIKPMLEGTLPLGLALKDITFEPEKIEIIEPTGENKEVIEKTEHIFTEPIKLAEITHDTRKVVKLDLPDGLMSETVSVVANIRLIR